MSADRHPLLCCSCSEECTSLGKHPARRPNQSHLRNSETLRTICMCPHRCGANIWSWFVKRSSRCHNIFHSRVVERLRTKRVQSDFDTVEEFCSFNMVFMFIFIIIFIMSIYWFLLSQDDRLFFWHCRQIDRFCPVGGRWNFSFVSACLCFFCFFPNIIIYYFTLFPVILCNLLELVSIFCLPQHFLRLYYYYLVYYINF